LDIEWRRRQKVRTNDDECTAADKNRGTVKDKFADDHRLRENEKSESSHLSTPESAGEQRTVKLTNSRVVVASEDRDPFHFRSFDDSERLTF
jgi:hypothetical protein